MNGRDVLLLTSGAALGATAVVTLHSQRTLSPTPLEQRQPHPTGAGGLSRDQEVRSVALPLVHAPEDPGPAHLTDQNQLDRLRTRLRDVQRERSSLEAQVKTLESHLAQQANGKSLRRAAEFELTAEDWKKLAAKGRIKYRVPCLLSPDVLTNLQRPEYDELGLSPDDRKMVNDAHVRSYERVWGTLRPLCLQVVNNPSVVDLLGPSTCLSLMDQVESQTDLKALTDARRQVGEVRAGIRTPPEAGEPQHPMYTAYMTLTGESELFKADLAENVGTEEADRIWQGLRCANSEGGEMSQ